MSLTLLKRPYLLQPSKLRHKSWPELQSISALSSTGSLDSDILHFHAAGKYTIQCQTPCTALCRSASMQGNKLELVKEATKFMVKEMSAIDRLSLVSFNDQACCCQLSQSLGSLATRAMTARRLLCFL